MAYHLDVRLQCPKHHGFRPHIAGAGIRIVGNCPHCWRLVKLYEDWLALLGQVTHLIAPKRRRKEAA